MPLFAFGFGSVSMLGWLAVAAAPFIIHFLTKRRFREERFAAMEFLMAALKKQSRRMRLEQWLLLLLRMAIIIALVLAVAEPFFERAGIALESGQRTHHVIVLDASFSMGYRPTDKSRFDRGKELAEQLVAESSQGDGFSLILMADPPKAIIGTPALDDGQVISEIQSVELSHAGANLHAALAEIQRVLATAAKDQPKLVQHRVYFFTDLGRNTWSLAAKDSAATQEITKLVEELSQKAGLSVIDLGQAVADNLAVTQLTVEEPYVTLGKEVHFRAGIKNFGRQNQSQVPIEFFVDGQRLGHVRQDVAAGDTAMVTFRARFDSIGDRSIEAKVAGDSLDVDNHRFLAQPVKPAVRVLCINGEPIDTALHGTTDYVSLALSPRGARNVDSPIQVEIIREDALLERDLSAYDCVVAANVSQFTESEAQLLRGYLDRGGGLIFFLGDQVNRDRYNQILWANGDNAKRVLPASLGEVIAENRYTFDPLEYRHPLVQIFKNQVQSGLITRFPLVDTYYELQLPKGSRAQVALAFDGGDPFVVEESLGRGKSLLVASTADTEWSSLPVMPAWLPLVREMLSVTSRAQHDLRSLSVGDPLGGDTLAFSPGGSVLVTGPKELSRQVPVAMSQGLPTWSFEETLTSGMYQVQSQDRGGASRLFAVNVNLAESDLDRCDPDELPEQVELRTRWQDLDRTVTSKLTQDSRLQFPLLLLALVLLAAESFVAWYFGSSRG